LGSKIKLRKTGMLRNLNLWTLLLEKSLKWVT
jgi:hypothetical protein